MMTSQAPKPTREERLAAKLRENLRRRKAQGRTLSNAGSDAGPDTAGEETAAGARDDLSKPASKS